MENRAKPPFEHARHADEQLLVFRIAFTLVLIHILFSILLHQWL